MSEPTKPISAESDAGCYICQPDNPNASDEGCAPCDREFWGHVLQRADHFQHQYEQASEGKCGASGMPLPVCKASICDCFEFPWVTPDEAAADAYFDAPPPRCPECGSLVTDSGGRTEMRCIHAACRYMGTGVTTSPTPPVRTTE